MRTAKYPRRALLIISDGGDNHSRYTEGEVRKTAEEADVAIYAIGLYDSFFSTEEERLGPALLADLSQVTGGFSFIIDNQRDLVNAAAAISLQLRNRYLIGYRPETIHHDGKWHKITVKVKLPKKIDAKVQAKTGYYAPAE
jgi:Ca-activated chloride channel family protein